MEERTAALRAAQASGLVPRQGDARGHGHPRTGAFPAEGLAASWRTLLAPYGAAPAAVAAAFDEVAARYREPVRRYHTLEHVGEVLAAVERLADEAADPAAVRLAAWLHDLVYDPRASANEAASAAVAGELLPRLGVPAPVVAATARLVEMTASHDPAPGDADGRVLADADLAVLGAPPRRYRRYCADVRAEYAWLPEADYRAGRARVLGSFVARPRIFRTERFFAEREARARANLAEELAELSA